MSRPLPLDEFHFQIQKLMCPGSLTPRLNGDRAGREAWEREVRAELAKRGLEETRDLVCMFYAQMSVAQAVEEIAIDRKYQNDERGKP